MNIEQGRENYIMYSPDFSTYYLTLKALEILCFAVVQISIEMVKYLFSIMESLPLNSSESMNAYKDLKILFKSYAIMHIIMVYISIFKFL